MNVIFLDIDGPLLSRRMWAAADNFALIRMPVDERIAHLKLDPGSVGLISRACELVQAQLVLASNWRRTWPGDLGALRRKLEHEGLARDLWHHNWKLPVIPVGNKRSELEAWLNQNGPVTKAVFIDDEKQTCPSPVVQITVSLDDGFGMQAYRDTISYFGVSDPLDKGVQAQHAQ
ncbi:HAD domain-containing protein (plasmid) [Agrobacterium sp. rho-8.1]|nr:HAD domain-containing protein [Agrobacterium sp. rho-8.1]